MDHGAVMKREDMADLKSAAARRNGASPFSATACYETIPMLHRYHSTDGGFPMFRCDQCDQNQDSCKSPNRVVTHIRKREYPMGDVISHGTEIVKEIDLCDNCAIKFRLAGGVPIVVATNVRKITQLTD